MSDLFLSLFEDFFLIKIVFLFLLAFYIGFLLVILKQTRAMSNVIQYTSVSSIITIIALANLIFGILLFVTALVIL